MNKKRELEIAYIAFMQDVNDYAKKRCDELNRELEAKGIEERISYDFSDEYLGSDESFKAYLYSIKNYFSELIISILSIFKK